MKLTDLLILASEKQIRFEVKGDKLRVTIPDKVPQYLVNQLRARREEIVTFMKGDDIVDCRDCGRTTSRLVRIRDIGTSKPFKLCWSCYEGRCGVLPAYDWQIYPSGKVRSSKEEAQKRFRSSQDLHPYLTQKAIAGGEPFRLGLFFEDHLRIDSTCSIPFKEVCEIYLAWAAYNYVAVAPVTVFTAFMQNMGCERVDADGPIHFSNVSITRVSPKPRHRWDDETKVLAERVLKLRQEDLPPAPFEFRPGETVIDSKRFLAAFQNEIRAGEDHPRSQTGVLQEDMRMLGQLLQSTGNVNGAVEKD